MPMPVFFRWVVGLAIAIVALNIAADAMAMQADREPAVLIYLCLAWLFGAIWGQERNPDVQKHPGPIMRTALILTLLSMLTYGGVRLVAYMNGEIDQQLLEQLAVVVFVTFLISLLAYWLLGREPPPDDQAKVSKPKT